MPRPSSVRLRREPGHEHLVPVAVAGPILPPAQPLAHDPLVFTKSGVMVGLGEQRLEVHQVMDDMRSAGIDFLTMGQYLQPTPRHATVEEFVTPQAFDAYAAIARAKGFLLVAASPLTRSSYHAGDDFRIAKESIHFRPAAEGAAFRAAARDDRTRAGNPGSRGRRRGR